MQSPDERRGRGREGADRLWSQRSPDLPTEHQLGWALLRLGLDDTHWRIRAFEVSEGRPDPIVSRFDRQCQALGVLVASPALVAPR